MHRGYIKIFRKITDNPLWNKKPFSDGQAWVDLLMIANHKQGIIDKRGIRVNIKRGQVGYSVAALADKWGWSRGKVNRFLKYLENVHQIEQQKTRVTTIITLVNYEEYNQNEQQNGQQTDIKRTSNGHQTDTNKNEKNEKNKTTRFRADLFLSEHCQNNQLIKDWLQVRKTKKCANTQTAMNLFLKEVSKTNKSVEQVLELCCQKSWAGFNSKWDEGTTITGLSPVGDI